MKGVVADPGTTGKSRRFDMDGANSPKFYPSWCGLPYCKFDKMLIRWLSFILLLLLLAGCREPPEYVTRQMSIWNRYVSNGNDNYYNEIEVNFKLEEQGWFWIYRGGDRPAIYSDQKLNWQFQFSPERDSVYVNARFYHSLGAYPQLVTADTTFRLSEDKTLVFWNCGDSTVTEFPFPACLTDPDSLPGGTLLKNRLPRQFL